jgi:hypothetical protein
MSDNDINDFFSRYGSNQSTEEPKAETEGKKPSNVQARKITNAPSASVPTPTVPERPLAEPDQRQIDQAALAQQAQTGLKQAGPPQAASPVDSLSSMGKDLLPYVLPFAGGLAAKALWDKFSKGGGGDGGPPPPPSGPTHKELIEAEKLKQEVLKTKQAEIAHQNFIAKNTLTESEQLFGRKAKDATELRLMDKAYEQQKGVAGAASPPAATPAAPVAPSAGPAPAPAPSAAPASTAPAPAPTAPAPAVQSAPINQAPSTSPNQPAQVLATAETPAAVEQAVVKQEKIKKAVEPPPTGMKPQYTKKKGEMGPGGYNWFASQVGHEEAPARWEEQYGKRNVPYEQVQQEYQATRYPPTPKTIEGKSGGAFGKPEFIPEHIRGSSNLKGLAGLAGTAGLLMAAASPESQAAMTRASEAIKDIGISPEAILRGKGDELGRMGNAYVTAGNPNYLRELQSQIDVEKNPERKKVLLRELQKIGGSGAGRGIAPPSAYMR